jgi:predicted RNA-binding protein with PUA-like domain
MKRSYWLLKTEPSTYSFSKLLEDGKTNWNGVRNFQARNYLKEVSAGDIALIYHSGDEKAVVGIAQVTKGAYADPDPKKPGEWFQIDLKPLQAIKRPLSLKEMKSTPLLASLPLIKHTRLSVMPVTAAHYDVIMKLAEKK